MQQRLGQFVGVQYPGTKNETQRSCVGQRIWRDGNEASGERNRDTNNQACVHAPQGELRSGDESSDGERRHGVGLDERQVLCAREKV